MAKVLTPEESARSILAVFKASGARANQVLMLGTVDQDSSGQELLPSECRAFVHRLGGAHLLGGRP